MNKIERQGIDSKWLTNWKKNCKVMREVKETNGKNDVCWFEYYVQTGESLTKGLYPGAIVTPAREKWESSFLATTLSSYADARVWELERNAVEKNYVDLGLALRVFAAIYSSQMLKLSNHHRFPSRFQGRILQTMNFESLSYTALGIVIGCKKQAFVLARLQLEAYRKDYYKYKEHYPVAHFILRIMADYLNEPPLNLSGESLMDPICTTLFDLWREPDSEALIPVCLAACDAHTHRTRPQPLYGIHYEFKEFARTPVEVLLLFKLRELIGLSNPHIDHPLMNTALGVLPKEVNFDEIASGSDDLIKRVRDRMMQDGYDEEQIFAECYDAHKGGDIPLASLSDKGSDKPAVTDEFSGLELKAFASPDFGIVLNAPASWQEAGDGNIFQVIDPETNAQFTASAYQNPGIGLNQWVEARLGAVAKSMPYLREIKPPYEMQGATWSGVVAEYQGIFPDKGYESHYLVLCLCTDQLVISFTITADKKIFVMHEALYRWLLQKQLSVFRLIESQ